MTDWRATARETACLAARVQTAQQEGVVDEVHNPDPLPGYTTEALRQDGRHGVLWSPLWRLRVKLTALEQALLQTWSLHRLHFLHHDGASAFTYPLNVSRLQHTLGVLALVAHWHPDDLALRAAALLHDIGHFPFCHSAELVPGVDHHAMTRSRVIGEPVYGLLRNHDLDPDQLLALIEGDPPTPLHTRNGLLHLDHLDSWARQAQSAGYAEFPAHELLTHLSLQDNNVAADRATAEYIVRLIRQGNERHYAEGDVGPAAVLAFLLTLAQERALITLQELADATDEALLARLESVNDGRIAPLIGLLRREPWHITVRKLPSIDNISSVGLETPLLFHAGENDPTDSLVVVLNTLYDAVPLLAGVGQPITQVSVTARAELARINELPGAYKVTWV